MRNILAATALATLWATSSLAQTPKTEDEKTIYALGAVMGQGIATFSLTKAELEILKKGLMDGASGLKADIDVNEYGPKFDKLQRTRVEAMSKGFLEKAAKEKGAQALPSGLVYSTLKEGSGAQPAPTDTVKVHYKGTLVNGTEFDSSYKRGEPTEFPLNGVIPCWTEGVGKMKAGGKAKLVCPAKIAYGDRGAPPKIPGGSTLIFEVELLEVKKAAAPAK